MTILGIDTSLRSTGYGVIEVAGSRMKALDFGNIKNPPARAVSECLKTIYEKIASLIEEWRPDEMSIEKVIYAKNANSMLVLGEARGAVITAASLAALPVYEYEPRRVKSAVCGVGMAEKEQVQRMVKTLLALDGIPQNDAADALAMAICHAHSMRGALRLTSSIGAKMLAAKLNSNRI